MGIRVGVVSGVAALALAACAEPAQPPPTAEVSRVTWTNGIWPFTVDKGVLTCHDADALTFTANGTEYALNDAAEATGLFRDASPILIMGYVEIDDKRQPIQVDVDSRMVDRGRELCPPNDDGR